MVVPFLWKHRVRGPALDHVDSSGFRAPPDTMHPTTTTAPEFPVPLPSPRQTDVVVDPLATPLDDNQMTELALALHTRWHRTHVEDTEVKNIQCARLAGAFDDADVIAPVVAGWIRDTLLAAARDAERLHRIGTTPQRDVSPEDLDWYNAEPQVTLRRACYYAIKAPLPGISDWLYALAGGRPA